MFHDMNNSRFGLHGITTYFPKQYVSQTECETHDGVSEGKYTKGLGQEEMSVVDPSEDIVSMALTSVDDLLHQTGISESEVGRIEVGTETLIDKSKSVKSHLMGRFNAAGNFDVQGIDTINACYGGTSAVFNAMNWMHSPMWDGRYAIVVTGDIAIYERGPARPTGGAGMVAMLLGPDAPVVFESDTVCSHFEHAYDFYKPNLSSEYPTVDGALSNECYIRALDGCYDRFRDRVDSDFDWAIFHAPYGKLVRKAYHRLFEAENGKSAMSESQSGFDKSVKPCLELSRRCGNMYAGSVWSSLNSILASETTQVTNGERVAMFSYGSGFASSMFGLKIQDTSRFDGFATYRDRLDARVKISPTEFHRLCDQRDQALGGSTEPQYPTHPRVANGTFVCSNIDSMKRRTYRQIATKTFRRLKSVV